MISYEENYLLHSPNTETNHHSFATAALGRRKSNNWSKSDKFLYQEDIEVHSFMKEIGSLVANPSFKLARVSLSFFSSFIIHLLVEIWTSWQSWSTCGSDNKQSRKRSCDKIMFAVDENSNCSLNPYSNRFCPNAAIFPSPGKKHRKYVR